MNWYNTYNGKIGDGPINIMEDALRRAVDCYLHTLGRLPTMGELSDLFTHVTGVEVRVPTSVFATPVELPNPATTVRVNGVSGAMYVMPSIEAEQVKQALTDLVESTGTSRRLLLVETQSGDMHDCLHVQLDYQGPNAQEVTGLWIDLKKFEVNPRTGQLA